MYRLGEGINAEGLPFLFEGHAYLGDGTPLTDIDDEGRIVPSREALGSEEKICSGGALCLANRRSGIEALARALDKGDLVRAPILLLQLQIDSDSGLAKFNHWHKPPGSGGGQFTFGPEPGAATAGSSGFEGAALNMHLGLPLDRTMGRPVASPPGLPADPKLYDEIVILGAKDHSLAGIPINFNIPFPKEQLWIAYSAFDFEYLGIHGTAVGNIGQNSGHARPGYTAIIHTHPTWADPKPGSGDFGQKVPVYGITPNGVWVIKPGAKSATVIYGHPFQ
jgi:hypothetical protein